MSEVMVTVALFAGGDDEAQHEAQHETHDFLIRNVPHRAGPVEWRIFDLAAPENDLKKLLDDLGGDFGKPENQRGFLEAAAEMDRPHAIVATVERRP